MAPLHNDPPAESAHTPANLTPLPVQELHPKENTKKENTEKENPTTYVEFENSTAQTTNTKSSTRNIKHYVDGESLNRVISQMASRNEVSSEFLAQLGRDNQGRRLQKNASTMGRLQALKKKRVTA